MTQTILTYNITELSDEAKKKAYENWLNEGTEYPWANENKESLDEFIKSFPFRLIVNKWEYDAYSYDYQLGFDDENIAELSGPRLYAWLINHGYDELVKKDCPFTGYCMDETLLDNIRAFLKSPDKRVFKTLIDDCIDCFFKSCRDDYNYSQSFEYFIEHADINEYQFLENGRAL